MYEMNYCILVVALSVLVVSIDRLIGEPYTFIIALSLAVVVLVWRITLLRKE